MATIKQKNLAKLRLDNPKLEKGELVELGGYGASVIKTPAKALESKGYKEELAKFGLTQELITTALVEDIKSKPGKRVSELGLGADILKMTGKEEGGNNLTQINISIEAAERFNIKPNDFNGTTSPDNQG